MQLSLVRHVVLPLTMNF